MSDETKASNPDAQRKFTVGQEVESIGDITCLEGAGVKAGERGTVTSLMSLGIEVAFQSGKWIVAQHEVRPVGVMASGEGLTSSGETSVQPGQESGNSTPKVTG